MIKGLLHLITAAVISTSFAEDMVIFANGDVLTGKIIAETEETVLLKSPYLGEVKLTKKDVLETLYDKKGEVARQVPATPKTTPPTPAPKPAKKSEWSGQAGISIAMREKTDSSLNQTTGVVSDNTYKEDTYTVNGKLKWAGVRNSLDWGANFRYRSVDDEKKDDRFNLSQTYRFNFSPTYYAQAKTTYAEDYSRQVDSEKKQTAEIGIKWFDSKKFKLSTSGGGAYHAYNRYNNEYSDANGKFVLNIDANWNVISSLSLFQNYNHLGNLETYYFKWRGGVENKLIRDLYVRLEYRLERDTEVFNNDKAFYDRALMTSFLYKF